MVLLLHRFNIMCRHIAAWIKVIDPNIFAVALPLCLCFRWCDCITYYIRTSYLGRPETLERLKWIVRNRTKIAHDGIKWRKRTVPADATTMKQNKKKLNKKHPAAMGRAASADRHSDDEWWSWFDCVWNKKRISQHKKSAAISSLERLMSANANEPAYLSVSVWQCNRRTWQWKFQ